MSIQNDEYWMQQAIALALSTQKSGEVPVGSVIVHQGVCIARGANRVIQDNDPSAHAEIVALRAAGEQRDNYRLIDTTLYVTLEPCAMCVGAMIHARIARVVFGAFDPKTGAAGSVLNLFEQDYVNHHVEVTSGILAQSCGQILRDFFQQRRQENKKR